MQTTPISILTTGGTIEKSYSEFDGTLLNRTSLVRTHLLKRLRLPYSQVRVKDLLSKDSLYMTNEDRRFIYTQVESELAEGRAVVVLHGTDTMEHTAKFCLENIKNLAHPVVFTGAMKPLGFDDSDAQQNFTEALYAAAVVASGVYISFHGKLFKVPNVRKNKALGTFETYDL